VADHASRGCRRSQSRRDDLSELEYGAAQLKDRPLVRLYSRGSAKRLFSAFRDGRVTVEHPSLRGYLLPHRLRPFGWYVIITGRR
jgi:hypothetical protein